MMGLFETLCKVLGFGVMMLIAAAVIIVIVGIIADLIDKLSRRREAGVCRYDYKYDPQECVNPSCITDCKKNFKMMPIT